MKRIALIEFHFDFFFPIIDYFEQGGFEVSLWTSHRETLQKLPSKIFGYRSRYAQIGCTPSGERVSGVPDDDIVEVLLERQEMLLNQTKRFRVFLKWNRNSLWAHILAIADYWDKLIRSKNIDIVLYKTEPHMLFDYILFLLAKKRGKINLFFERLPFDSRVMVCENLDDIRAETRRRLASENENNWEHGDVVSTGADGNNAHIEPPFHYKFKRDRFKNNTVKKIWGGLHKIWRLDKWRHALKKNTTLLARNKEFWETIGADQNKPLKLSWPHYIAGAMLRSVIYTHAQKYTLALCNFLLFRGHFEQSGFLFCLQCQPERSTNPCGGSQYFDQIRLIRDISGIIGPHRLLFVKEHPSQFSSYQYPEIGRSFKFYYDLLRLKNVVLLPSLPTAEKLIESAGCVISVGGSACWGAIKKGVPAIVCGQVGYAACEGALPGRNREELTAAIEKLSRITPPDGTISDAAASFESRCKGISEKAYLDRVYEQKFDPHYDNALMLSLLVNKFLANRIPPGEDTE